MLWRFCKGYKHTFWGDQENLDDRNRSALEHGNWAHGGQVEWVHHRLKGCYEEKPGNYGV